jgi:hypothetical protein
MHITPEFAGLVAQVFPTLLIAILIEGRLGPALSWARWVNLVLHYLRMLAILGATASTFACLNIARSGNGDEFTDWVVNITAYLLLIATAAMAGTVMGGERMAISEGFRQRANDDKLLLAATKRDQVTGSRR